MVAIKNHNNVRLLTYIRLYAKFNLDYIFESELKFKHNKVGNIVNLYICYFSKYNYLSAHNVSYVYVFVLIHYFHIIPVRRLLI